MPPRQTLDSPSAPTSVPRFVVVAVLPRRREHQIPARNAVVPPRRRRNALLEIGQRQPRLLRTKRLQALRVRKHRRDLGVVPPPGPGRQSTAIRLTAGKFEQRRRDAVGHPPQGGGKRGGKKTDQKPTAHPRPP